MGTLKAARYVLTVSSLGLLMMAAGCDVDQTQEGELPDVDVEGGQLPEFDVDAPDVDVSTEERTITVPDVDVDFPDENDTEIEPQ